MCVSLPSEMLQGARKASPLRADVSRFLDLKFLRRP